MVDDRGAADPAHGAGFERQPPQDLAAEQSVLGGMLLSKDAIADVVEVVRAGDFYRPAHQNIFDCVLDLYGRGEPADAITVSAELERRNELVRVGGAPYLHTLIATVPTAANAGYYAEIVAEKAVLRRLIEAGTRIVQLGHNGNDGGQIDEVVDRAQAAIYEVTERRTAEDYVALEELLQPTMDEIDAIASRGGAAVGIPTGFTDLDAVTNGLHPGQMIIVAARPGVGKALALDTPLPTPDGWTTMGDVQLGDHLIGADGAPTTVVAATEVLTGRPCYEVEFADGSVIVADGEHQWLTETRAAGRSAHDTGGDWSREQRTFAEVRTTVQLAETLRCATADRRLDHSVPNAQPIQRPEAEVVFPPYTLGAWLGDGTSTGAQVTCVDAEIIWNIEAEGIRATLDGDARYTLELTEPEPDTVQARLRTVGVLGAKHIPPVYLRASESQRRVLLAGLLDIAGTVTADGSVQLSVTEPRLASDVRELLVGLGYRCGPTSTAHRITFATPDSVFGLERKRLVHKDRHRAAEQTQTGTRSVVDVRPVDSVPVRCVEVDAADHLYLAGRSMIPTHNSTLGLDFARSCSVKHGMTSAIFSLEMSRTEIVMRMLSAEARIRLQDMRGGRMTDDDWTRLARRMSEISEAPLFVDDSPNLTMMEIRAKARRLKQRNDLKLVVVDYLQLMSSGKRVESRQQEVSEFSRHLKLLAKEIEVPVIAISQLNRGPEQRTDKRPMLSDLRESGCLTLGTRILRADTGAEVTFGDLLLSGEKPLVWSLDERLRMTARPMTTVFSSGVKEVFRVRLASGREIEATANHPMLTVDGWVPLGDLDVGSRVGVPRRSPEPFDVCPMPEPELTTLAHLVSDGSVGGHEMVVPEQVFALPNDQVARFLGHLWSANGSVRWDDSAGQAGLRYSTTSRRLADDITCLLSRLGVFGRIETTRGHDDLDCFHVVISGAENQLAFLDQVPLHGIRGLAATAAAEKVRGLAGNTNVDTVPHQLWTKVRGLLAAKSITHQTTAAALSSKFCGSTQWKHAPSRARLARVAALLDDAQVTMLATNDVFWDQITEVVSLGEQPVYDATVPGTHNFLANGIAMHNSLEQDADVVILINRPDAFERDDPRMGEADLILAKHRAGPTSTITVAHQLHYSRFVDMAQN